MNQLPTGSMLAVPLSEEEVRPLLGEDLSLAAINGPSLSIVSGPNKAVTRLQSQFIEKGLEVRRLQTSHAFHSQMMEPILKPFIEQIRQVELNAPKRAYLSNVTGTWITSAQATDPNYWASHIRDAVRFAEGMEELFGEPGRVFMEVGPGRTLSSLAKLHPNTDRDQIIFPSIRHPQDRQSDVAFLLNALGRLYLSGVKIDWSKFYAGERRHRISLPTYPFERQRYWIQPKNKRCSDGIRRITLEKKPDIADWFYIPSWKRSLPPRMLNRESSSDQNASWLIFVDDSGLGAEMEQYLRQHGQKVVSVRAGERFSRLSEVLFVINPQLRDNYDALIKELRAEGKTPNKIVHLWSVTANHRGQSGLVVFEQSQQLGFYSLLFLAQALGEQRITGSLQIDVISNNMQEVHGEAIICPEKATVMGPCNVIPREYPNISCRNIDIDLSQSRKEQMGDLAEQLIEELNSKQTDLLVAYRGKHRWVQTFEPVRLESNAFATRLKKNGVYLITGGLGGLGFVFAEYLAQTVQARLVLIGRALLPARDEWRQWLADHDHKDNVSQKIQTVERLEELGAEVLVARTDVTDLEQMQEVVSQAYTRFGGINGVIHAAGVAGEGMIQRKTSAMAASVLAPKIKGTRVLEKVLKNVSLDFFVLCSSTLSITGGLGQVDYCAANAFLDAFSHSNTTIDSKFTVAVNWCAWQKIGMAVDAKVPPGLYNWKQENLKTGILPEEGKDAFGRILGSMLPQVLVSTRDLNYRIDEQDCQLINSTELRNPDDIRSPKTPHGRPKLSNNYVAPTNDVETTIAEIWQEVFGLDQVGLCDNFFDLGGHSLLASRAISRIRDALQVDLPVQALFENPTVAGLTEAILNDPLVRNKVERTARLFLRLRQLSSDEVATLLSQKRSLLSENIQ
jgi:acyl transferase domain-containing protein